MLCFKSVMFITKTYGWLYCGLKYGGFPTCGDNEFIASVAAELILGFPCDGGKTELGSKKCDDWLHVRMDVGFEDL